MMCESAVARLTVALAILVDFVTSVRGIRLKGASRPPYLLVPLGFQLRGGSVMDPATFTARLLNLRLASVSATGLPSRRPGF